MNKSIGSMLPMFLFTPSYALREQHKEVASKEATKVDGRSGKGALFQWALAHKDWTVEDFQRAIYSDECTVEQEPAGHQRWLVRTPREKWQKD